MKTTISITLEQTLIDKVKELSKQNYTNVSQEIRRILREYFDNCND